MRLGQDGSKIFSIEFAIKEKDIPEDTLEGDMLEGDMLVVDTAEKKRIGEGGR